MVSMYTHLYAPEVKDNKSLLMYEYILNEWKKKNFKSLQEIWENKIAWK